MVDEKLTSLNREMDKLKISKSAVSLKDEAIWKLRTKLIVQYWTFT